MFEIFIFLHFFIFSNCYNNGVGKVPAMGWNSWNQFGCAINEQLILDTIAGLKKYKLDEFGYKYINLDDCWQLVDRDSEGVVQIDTKAFPNGIKFLASELHEKGLKLGIYTDIGTNTCQGRAGSYGYYDIDAKTYAGWEIDYLKCDFCNSPTEVKNAPWEYYGNFSKLLNQTGRPILFSICNWGVREPWKWAPQISNSWRTTGDIKPNYKSMITNVENSQFKEYAGNYNFNDPDMLEVGVVRSTHLSPVENKAHFSIWCMMASPLLLGLDLREINDTILEIITNKEVISINQDELGLQGWIAKENKIHLIEEICAAIPEERCTWTQIWMKPLSDNKIAVMLFNRASKNEVSHSLYQDEFITVHWEDIGLDKDQKMKIRDVWEHKDLGVFKGSFTSLKAIEQHDVNVLILEPTN